MYTLRTITRIMKSLSVVNTNAWSASVSGWNVNVLNANIGVNIVMTIAMITAMIAVTATSVIMMFIVITDVAVTDLITMTIVN